MFCDKIRRGRQKPTSILSARKLTKVNINQLEYFVATMRHGSFSSAAKELFVAPQTVSKAVNDLERELRTNLYERTKRSVEPTPFGRVFSMRASEILSHLVELEHLAKSQASPQTEEGSVALAVACSPLRGNVLRPDDFASFDKAHPLIKLDRTYHSSGSCLAALEESVVDAALIAGRVAKPGISCIRLFSAPLSLAISRDHPLARRDRIDLGELQGTPIAAPEDLRYCHRAIADHLLAKGVEPDFVALPPYAADHRSFLEDRLGAFFVVDDPALSLLYPSAVALPIASENSVAIPLCLAYAQNDENHALPAVERYLIGLATHVRRQGR